jgi:hypothetical protein
VVKHFVGSEYGHKQSVKLLQNMVYSTIQHPPPPPTPTPTVTHCMYCTFSLGRGDGGGGQRNGREAIFTSWVENTNMS